MARKMGHFNPRLALATGKRRRIGNGAKMGKDKPRLACETGLRETSGAWARFSHGLARNRRAGIDSPVGPLSEAGRG